MHVVVAMSGGVDSSVAAALLAEQGHRVTGVFLRNGVAPGRASHAGKQGCCSAGDALDASRVADLLGVPFYSLDFAGRFDAIVRDFAAQYADGRTPNPCIACNRDLKFGELLRFADSLGADAVATGHYARIDSVDGRHGLRIPADRRKDQTYVLFPLSQEQLGRTLFPLGEMDKASTRLRARELGLPVTDKPESMEICFVPGGDYREVLAVHAPAAVTPGPIVDGATGAVTGRHGGVGTVTVGQRRGLGAAAEGLPRYVTSVDAGTNTVVVGTAQDLLRRVVRVDGWTDGAQILPAPGSSVPGVARIRRNHAPQPAVAEREKGGPGRVRVTFDPPARAPAPGQALVLYDTEDRVVGGGWITSSST